MLSIEKAMEKSHMGFARHQVIYDENKKAVDFIFLSVNASFERMTGLKKKAILNKRVTEVIPKITDDDFDWISFYGEIATEGKNRVFEQYSYPLERWYSIEAFSCEPGYFITIFTDISKNKLMENKVTEQTVLLSKIFDSFPGFIGLKDESGRFIMANKALSDQWGFDSVEMI